MRVNMEKYVPKRSLPHHFDDTVFPRRLLLDAFSAKIGWRSGGLNSGQIEAFVHRFPTEFRYIAMGHVHLPYDKTENLPFVVPLEDGEFKFPCPILSTMNALKFLVSNPQM